METFAARARQRQSAVESLLCIGLDSDPERIPTVLRRENDPQLAFNREIVEATHGLALCYKLNFAFYTVRGPAGVQTLLSTIELIREKGIPVILDAKFGDIGNTAAQYAKTAFDVLGADSVTLNPYMGEEAIAPFRERADRCSFILCFTSNLSRVDVQTQMIAAEGGETAPLYRHVAQKIAAWNEKDNLGAVAGATAPEELEEIRGILGPSIPVLCPGVGVQGGDLEEALWAGYSGPGSLLVNVSRAIIHASMQIGFGEAAREEAEMFVRQMKTFLEQYGVEENGRI